MNKTRSFLHIVSIKDSLQQQIHFNGNIFGNKCCRCNDGSLYIVKSTPQCQIYFNNSLRVLLVKSWELRKISCSNFDYGFIFYLWTSGKFHNGTFWIFTAHQPCKIPFRTFSSIILGIIVCRSHKICNICTRINSDYYMHNILQIDTWNLQNQPVHIGNKHCIEEASSEWKWPLCSNKKKNNPEAFVCSFTVI